jgi:DNA polymerase elongation subunit (family B)
MNRFYTSVIPQRNTILYRGYNNGRSVKSVIKEFQPSLFIPCDESQSDGWRDIHGNPLYRKKFQDMNSCREYMKTKKSTEYFGNADFEYQFIAENFPEEMNVDFRLVNVCYLDIEVSSDENFSSASDATERILLITCALSNGKSITFVLGNLNRKNYGVDEVLCFSDERKMLTEFLLWWNKQNIDVVTGWNVKFYDIPYIVNRINRLFPEGGVEYLSPWRKLRAKSENFMNRDNDIFEIVGIATLDFLQLYTKFTFVKRESYTLDHIARVELGKTKLDWKSKYKTMREFYEKDYETFVEYNIIDVQIVQNLESKLKLIDLCLAMAYQAKVNFSDVLSQTRTWDQIVYHHLHERKIAIPQKTMEEKSSQYEGAYVKEPVAGIYNWIVSFDLASLYPHLIMQYGISPDIAVDINKIENDAKNDEDARRLLELCKNVDIEKLLKKEYDTSILKKFNFSMAANGKLYRRDRPGFLPLLMEQMYVDRKKAKNRGILMKKRAESVRHELKRRGLS